MFFWGSWLWHLAGTQTVDGHWKVLRRNGAHRGVNTSLEDAVHTAVLVHAWAQWAGPSADIRDALTSLPVVAVCLVDCAPRVSVRISRRGLPLNGEMHPLVIGSPARFLMTHRGLEGSKKVYVYGLGLQRQCIHGYDGIPGRYAEGSAPSAPGRHQCRKAGESWGRERTVCGNNPAWRVSILEI